MWQHTIVDSAVSIKFLFIKTKRFKLNGMHKALTSASTENVWNKLKC